MDIYFYWQRGSCMSGTAQHTVGITTTEWIPTRTMPLLLVPLPFLDNTGRQFQNENHTFSFALQKKIWPCCLQAACTCSPSCTFNCPAVQAADPSPNAVSMTGTCRAAESHSLSLQPIREARAFSLGIISGFKLEEVLWNNEFYKLPFFFQVLPNIPLPMTVSTVTEIIRWGFGVF